MGCGLLGFGILRAGACDAILAGLSLLSTLLRHGAARIPCGFNY